jgi:acyl-CoA synthetase (AMP-forming)/AMP-acid ligase II
MQPDRSAAGLRAIVGKDTALLFYFKDAKGRKQATRYTHTLLLEHIARIETLLGKSALRAEELVMTTTSWEQPIGHIAACYCPVTKEAMVQITHAVPDVSLFENNAHVAVGDAAFFDGIRESIEKVVRQSGQIESMMLAKAVSLSKPSYESPGGIRPLLRMQKAALQATIVKKVRKMLGANLRLFIGTDNEAHYDTQLFFHTFGIELVELPQEVFR